MLGKYGEAIIAPNHQTGQQGSEHTFCTDGFDDCQADLVGLLTSGNEKLLVVIGQSLGMLPVEMGQCDGREGPSDKGALESELLFLDQLAQDSIALACD